MVENAGSTEGAVAVGTQRLRRKEATRQRIVAAALEVFGEYGYLSAPMDEIARRAEVARPTVYFHFSSKADLARAVGVGTFHASASVFLELAELDPEDLVGIRRWVREYGAFCAAHAAAVSVGLQASAADLALSEEHLAIHGGRAAEIVHRIQPDAAAPSADAVDRLRFLLMAVERYAYLTSVQGVTSATTGFERAACAVVQSTLRDVRALARA